MAIIGTNINKARSLLEAGQLVAIPTETVYGLAGNGFDTRAVASIFETKKRPAFDPLILHADSLEKVEQFVEKIPAPAKLLAERFWPGPLTILFKKNKRVPDLVTSGLQTVAVRIPRHPLALELLALLDFPLAAPSANPFGYVSPTRPEHVQAQLGGVLPYILDGGVCSVGVESTIVSFEGELPAVLRMGGLSLEYLEEVLGKIKVNSHSSTSPAAPGMLRSHYAPQKPFVLIDNADAFERPKNNHFAILAFNRRLKGVKEEQQFLLAPSGSVSEAAANLFSMIRQLDERKEFSQIIALKVPEEGLGRAVNDRLRRAATIEL